MRTLLLASLSLAAALTTPRDAEACGGYMPEPAALQLSTHSIDGRGMPETRTFALLPWEAVPEGLTWDRLSWASFDATQIARARPLAKPLTLTLLGPAGTRVVTATQRVFLDRAWKHRAHVAAVQLDVPQGFRIALRGAHANARWVALEDRVSTPALSKWLAKHAAAHGKPDSVHVSRIAGTAIEVVSFYSVTERRLVTLLKEGEHSAGELDGMPLGAFAYNGGLHLVLPDGAATRQVFLGRSS